MNIPIVSGDIVDDGGFDRPRFVRVSRYHWVPITNFSRSRDLELANLSHARERARRTSRMIVEFGFCGASYDANPASSDSFGIIGCDHRRRSSATRVDLDAFPSDPLDDRSIKRPVILSLSLLPAFRVVFTAKMLPN